MATTEIRPLGMPPAAIVELPGSKSIGNRALLAAALATGRSTLTGLLSAADTDAMLESVRRIGARVVPASTGVEIEGTAGRIRSGPLDLAVAQSGTTARFITATLALGNGRYRIDADPQMRDRPMGDLFDAMRNLGVTVDDSIRPGHLPAVVEAHGVDGGHIEIPGDISSQFVSGLLLAAPLMARGLEIRLVGPTVSRPYLAMTVAVMEAFGASVHSTEAGFVIDPTGYRPARFTVEPDASAASYFFAAAAITGGRVRVQGLGRASIQGDVAFVDVLERMGAEIERTTDWIEVRGTGTLRGVDVDMADFSDTVPTLAVTAAFASSPTRIRGVGFIRGKESDRLAASAAELGRCGIEADVLADGLVVRPGAFHGADVHTYDDHRIAMAFAVAGLVVPGVRIVGSECVAKTFPRFFETLDSLRTASLGEARS